ncbi:MAG: hypothetical protein ACE14Q_04970 [Acidobacteriota bacterium]
MNRVLFFSFLFLLFALPSFCQEVVVFADDRSLTVKSHREKEGFVYLQLPEGEIAVPKKQIKEIRQEKASFQPTSTVEPKGLSPELPQKPAISDRRKPPQLLRNVISKSQPNPKVENEDDDDEAEGDDEDDDDDAESPPPSVEEQKPRPLMPMKIGDAPGSERAPRLGPAIRKR